MVDSLYIRVPDHAPVLDTDLLEALVDLAELLYTLIKRVLGTAHENSVSTDSLNPRRRNRHTGRQPRQPAWPFAYLDESWRWE